jgi:hypothetical protein
MLSSYAPYTEPLKMSVCGEDGSPPPPKIPRYGRRTLSGSAEGRDCADTPAGAARAVAATQAAEIQVFNMVFLER